MSAARGRDRGRAPALPADPHDRLRVHHGRHPAHARLGLGRGVARRSWAPPSSSACRSRRSLGVFLTPAFFRLVEGLGPQERARSPNPDPPRRPSREATDEPTPVAILATLTLALGLAACMVGPVVPAAEDREPRVQWRDEAAPDSTTLANLPGGTCTRTRVLQELIADRAAREPGPPDRRRTHRRGRARALGFTKADLWPQIDLSATGTRFQDSRNGVPPIPEGTGQHGHGLGPVGARLLGARPLRPHPQRQRGGAGADAGVTEAGQPARWPSRWWRRSRRPTCLLRAADLQLAVARNTLESRRQYIDLARTRFEGGITSETRLAPGGGGVVPHPSDRAGARAACPSGREPAISCSSAGFPGEVLRGREVPRDGGLPPALRPGSRT